VCKQACDGMVLQSFLVHVSPGRACRKPSRRGSWRWSRRRNEAYPTPYALRNRWPRPREGRFASGARRCVGYTRQPGRTCEGGKGQARCRHGPGNCCWRPRSGPGSGGPGGLRASWRRRRSGNRGSAAASSPSRIVKLPNRATALLVARYRLRQRIPEGYNPRSCRRMGLAERPMDACIPVAAEAHLCLE
jgi:hypothetical protein